MTDTLLLDQPLPGVHVITFNRPQAHNALDVATMQAYNAKRTGEKYLIRP